MKSIAILALGGLSLTLAACGDDTRTATAETSVATAEVSTTMPPAAVSDAQLEATANRAAANASQPPEGSLTPGGPTTVPPAAPTPTPAPAY